MTETSTGKPTDEMVETAAQAMWERIDREESWSEIYHASAYRRDARAALEAAAPLIAATALQPIRDALANHPRCEEHPDGDAITCGWKAAVLDVQRALEARNG